MRAQESPGAHRHSVNGQMQAHETVIAGAGPRRNAAAGPKQEGEHPAAKRARGSGAGKSSRRRKRGEAKRRDGDHFPRYVRHAVTT